MIFRCSEMRTIFAFVSISIAVSTVHTFVIEYGAVSLHELMQRNREAYGVYGNGNGADIDVPKGSTIQILPSRYGLNNRGYPPGEINLYLSKHKQHSGSSEGSSRSYNSSEDRSRSHHPHRHDRDRSPERDHRHSHDHSPEQDHGHSKDHSPERDHGHSKDHSSERDHGQSEDHSPERDHENSDDHMPEDHSTQDSSTEDLSEEHHEAAEHAEKDADEYREEASEALDEAEIHRELAEEEREEGDSEAAEAEEQMAAMAEKKAEVLNEMADIDDAIAEEEEKMARGEGEYGSHEHHKGNGHGDGHDHGHHDNDGHGNHDTHENGHYGGHENHGDHEDKHKLDRRSPFFTPLLSSSVNNDPETLKPTSDPDGTSATVDTSVSDSTTDTGGASVSVDTSVSTPSGDVETSTTASVEANNINDDVQLTSDTNIDSSITTDTVDSNVDTSMTTDTVDANIDSSVTTDTVDTNINSSVATDVSTSSSSSSSSTSSSWFSWILPAEEPPKYSPYTLLKFLSPTDTSADSLASMFSVFSDPTNASYLQNASTMMRIVLFFMPGTGIVDQVYFTMAVSKIMWEAATMYYEGYGNVPIAITVLSDLAYESVLARRDDTAVGDTSSIIQKAIIIPGECVDVSHMDVPTFLKYIRNMEYPALTPEQEKKLRDDIDNLVSITFPTISDDLKTSFVDGLKDSAKFLALVNVKGDLIVQNADVNFADVYVTMHSAFDTDSLLQKIEKKIEATIDMMRHLPDLVMDP